MPRLENGIRARILHVLISAALYMWFGSSELDNAPKQWNATKRGTYRNGEGRRLSMRLGSPCG
jgi:hypothetical protein